MRLTDWRNCLNRFPHAVGENFRWTISCLSVRQSARLTETLSGSLQSERAYVSCLNSTVPRQVLSFLRTLDGEKEEHKDAVGQMPSVDAAKWSREPKASLRFQQKQHSDDFRAMVPNRWSGKLRTGPSGFQNIRIKNICWWKNSSTLTTHSTKPSQ